MFPCIHHATSFKHSPLLSLGSNDYVTEHEYESYGNNGSDDGVYGTVGDTIQFAINGRQHTLCGVSLGIILLTSAVMMSSTLLLMLINQCNPTYLRR